MDLSVVANAPDGGKFRVLAIGQDANGHPYFEPVDDFGALEDAKGAANDLVLRKEEPRTRWALVINDMGETQYVTTEWVQ
jgi:hypothetical protein